jgi:hypothetical protein
MEAGYKTEIVNLAEYPETKKIDYQRPQQLTDGDLHDNAFVLILSI